MSRSNPRRALAPTWEAITTALEADGVLPLLARRLAMQLVCKVPRSALGDRATWRAIAAQLGEETERLRSSLGLVDRQIVVALPKLAPAAIDALLASLTRREPSVARTILNAALDASVPAVAAERYLEEYRRVVAALSHLEPALARTMANATFMARRPAQKARHHLRHFDQLVTEFGRTETPIRTLAREACRAPRPRAAGQKFVEDRRTVLDRLRRRGTDVTVARTIASIACVSADPVARGEELLAHFEAVLQMVRAVHPRAARSIALSACRSPTPLAAARRYMANYDRVVEMVSRVDERHAHRVAAQVFRSDDPLPWARRYLSECQLAAAGQPGGVFHGRGR